MAKNHVTTGRVAINKTAAVAKGARIGKKAMVAKSFRGGKGWATLQVDAEGTLIGAAAFRKAAKAYTVKATKTRDSALDTLRREGILTKSGEYAKAFV